eukprot:358758_1
MANLCAAEQELTSMNTQLNVNDMDDNNPTFEALNNTSQQPHKKNTLCYVLTWFYSPFCSINNFIHSFCCFIYHWINFGFAFAIWTYSIFALTASITLIIFACIGLLLLWFTFEIIVLFSRLDLWMNYIFVEYKHQKQYIKPLLTLCIYTEGLPLCGCDGCWSIMINRARHLFTSCNFYKLLSYHLIIRPIIVLFTGWSWFMVVCIGYYISIPIWYYNVSDLVTKNSGIYWPYTFEYSILISIGCLFILLPITIKISNFCAYTSKRIAYYFYINCCCCVNNDDQKALINVKMEMFDDENMEQCIEN